MSKLYPPQKLISPRRQQSVKGWRKDTKETESITWQPTTEAGPGTALLEFKDLPINEAIELLGRSGGLEDKLYYLKSQGFDSFELATYLFCLSTVSE